MWLMRLERRERTRVEEASWIVEEMYAGVSFITGVLKCRERDISVYLWVFGILSFII